MAGVKFLPWVFLVLGPTADAVVVASGGLNNTAPAGQPYFANVGPGGIYLGDGWVLTAAHVAGSLPATASFGGLSYATEPGSFYRLQNNPPLTTLTDIVLFRLSSPPALPGMEISSTTPTVGSEVMMIGNGRTQEGALTHWDRTVISGNDNDTWVEGPAISSNISGWETTGTQEVRWGTNRVHNVGLVVTLPAGNVVAFSTQFDKAGLAEEAQAVSGDSGGAVLSQNGSQWELSGMMVAVSTYEMQPGGAATAVFGVQTAIADLSYYRGQIYSIIPEPSVAGLWLLGAVAGLRRRR